MTFIFYAKPTGDLWRNVKITCRKPSIPIPPECPIKFMAPRFITAMKAKRMMKAHFPDGPRAAEAAHKAYWDWEMENLRLGLLFEWKKPMNAEALRWEAFEIALRKWNIAQQARQIMHGQLPHGGVDFSRLDRKRAGEGGQ